MMNENSTHFVSSLAKAIQTCCQGHINFSSSIEVIGHIHLNIDRSVKLDYVLTEEVSKTANNGAAFTSHSYHSQPPPNVSANTAAESCNCFDTAFHPMPDEGSCKSPLTAGPGCAPIIAVSMPSDVAPTSSAHSWDEHGQAGGASGIANLTVSFGPSPLLSIKQENGQPPEISTQDNLMPQLLAATHSGEGEGPRPTETYQPEHFPSSATSTQRNLQLSVTQTQGNPQGTVSHTDGDLQLPPVSSHIQDGLGLQPAVTSQQRMMQPHRLETFLPAGTHSLNTVHESVNLPQEISHQTAVHIHSHSVENTQPMNSVTCVQENVGSAMHPMHYNFQPSVSSPQQTQLLAVSQIDENVQPIVTCSQESSNHQCVSAPSLEEAPSTSAKHTFSVDGGLRVEVQNPGFSVVHIKQEPEDDRPEPDYMLDDSSHMEDEHVLQTGDFSNLVALERLGHRLLLVTDQGQQQPFPVMLHTMPGVAGQVSSTVPTSISLGMPTSVRIGSPSSLIPMPMAPMSLSGLPADPQGVPSLSSRVPRRGRRRKRKNLKAAQKAQSTQDSTKPKGMKKIKKSVVGVSDSTKAAIVRKCRGKINYKSSAVTMSKAVNKTTAGKLLANKVQGNRTSGHTKMAKTPKKKAAITCVSSSKQSSTTKSVAAKDGSARTSTSQSWKSHRHGLTKLTKNMVCRRDYTQDDIQIAIEQVHEGMSVIEASWKYGIPLPTLFGRSRKGCKTHSGRCSQVHGNAGRVASTGPIRHHKTKYYRKYSHDIIELAIQDVHSGTSIQAASVRHNIAKSTLYLRSTKGCPSHAGKCLQVCKQLK